MNSPFPSFTCHWSDGGELSPRPPSTVMPPVTFTLLTLAYAAMGLAVASFGSTPPYLFYVATVVWLLGWRWGVFSLGMILVGVWVFPPVDEPLETMFRRMFVHLVSGSVAIPLVVYVRDKLSKVEDLSAFNLQMAKRWRVLADSVPNIVWVCDPAGEVLYYNRRWYEYVEGAKSNKPEGDGPPSGTLKAVHVDAVSQALWRKVMHPDDLPRVEAVWRNANDRMFEVEYRLRSKAGEYRWFLCRGLPFRDESGRVVQWYGNMTDIHDQKMMQQELESSRRKLQEQADRMRELDRQKDQCMATVAHELRNPLAPVTNNLHILEMIINGDRDWESVSRCHKVMYRQVKSMGRMIEDLLDFNRIRQGKAPLEKDRVDLCQIVERVVAAQRPAIEGRYHTVHTMNSPPAPVEVDVHRMEQVLTNLIVNSCKYTEPGGTIWVSAASKDGKAILKVRDTGMGLAEGVAEHIFDMYTQAERSLDRSQGGLGIGLTLVKDIVEQHGGAVSVFSKGTGQGCEFTVELPESPGPVGRMSETSGEHAVLRAVTSKVMNLLVVDDNKDAADSLGALLQMYGHTVEIVHDGIEAIQKVQTNKPDAVLLDLGLPGMDGFTVCKKLRKEHGPGLKIIAVTGYNSEEDRKLSAKVGFDEHLTKPVDPRELNALLVE